MKKYTAEEVIKIISDRIEWLERKQRTNPSRDIIDLLIINKKVLIAVKGDKIK